MEMITLRERAFFYGSGTEFFLGISCRNNFMQMAESVKVLKRNGSAVAAQQPPLNQKNRS
jgi:hypothetical protein